jgi:hypothetical protein
MKKDPSLWDHAGVSYAHIPLGRAGGAGTRPAFLSLSPAIVQGCIKQLTSNDGG